MKTFRKLGMAIMVVLMALNFSACSDDDDNQGGGAISATLDGANMGLNHVYWWIIRSYSDHKTMEIEFYSYDPVHPGNISSASFAAISYDIPNNQNDIQSVTLAGDEYEIYVAKDVSMNSDGWQGETMSDATANSPLTITRNGDTVTIKVDRAEVSGDDPNDVKIFSINYSGSIPYLPEDLQEN